MADTRESQALATTGQVLASLRSLPQRDAALSLLIEAIEADRARLTARLGGAS